MVAELTGHYHAGMVAASVAAAMVSSYVALSLAPRIHDQDSSVRRALFWTLAFGVCLGAGIWTMHFIAMLAFSLPVPVRYDPWLTAASMLVAVAFTALCAWPMRRGGRLAGTKLAIVGTLTGLGIAGMHYTGMAAMRMAATVEYDRTLVGASILIAVAASSVALWLANRLRGAEVMGETALKLAASVVMGVAISAMHYTGMAAAHFHAAPDALGPAAGLDTNMLAAGIVGVFVLVQGGALALAAVDDARAAVLRNVAVERRLAAMLRAMPDAVLAVNERGEIEQANPAAERLFGYAAEEWPGLPMERLVPEDALERHRQGFARQLKEPAGGPLRDMQVRARRKDGSVFPCELSISDYRDESHGGSRHFIVVVRDISARRAAEEESARLRMAVEQTPEGVFITDAEGRIVYANAAVERMTGLSREELLGRLAAEVRGGEAGDAMFAEIMEYMDNGLPWLGDVEYQRPDGEKRIIERHIAPVVVDGETRWHVCVDTDVTEQRKARAAMEHSQRLESLGVLAGGIAHDFNNLLAAIMGNAGLARMKAGANPEAMREVTPYLKRIEDSSQRAAELCKQMLAYSGKGKFVVEPINLSDMVREITNLLEVSIAKNVVLKFHLAENLPAVDADAAQLQQVIMNLVINASEAIGEHSGVISLSTGMMHADEDYLKGAHAAEGLKPGRYVYLEVADTGCGMDAATQKRLFDPFFTTKFTGRGLGMSAVLGIVRGHHGAIKVCSEPGQGTTFKVLLPASDARAARAGEREAWGEWCGVGAVLVVDDEETIRETASAMLEEMGFSTLTAADGEEGVAVYREHCDEIVAVLLDMTMPKLDGKACFRELRRVNPDVRVILSSGYNEQDATSRFAGQGLAGFIQKPYAPEALREAMRKALASGEG